MKNLTINDLAKIKKIINLIINVLESNISNFSNGSIYKENKEFIEFLIGNKENVVSIISKLTNLLVKVIPLEEKILLENNTTPEEKLDESDMEILKKYIDRCLNNNKKLNE